MIFYRLTDRTFSRRWRRNKDYKEKDLMHLARRYGCALEKFTGGIRLKERGEVVANFKEVVIPDKPLHESDLTKLYAALRNPTRGRVVIHTVRSAVSVVPSSVSVVKAKDEHGH